jgi:hypothetical protein
MTGDDRAMSSPATEPRGTSHPGGEVTARVDDRPDTAAPAGVPGLWAWLSVAAGVLSAAGCGVGLLAPGTIYGSERRALADAATAQDLVGLIAVAPLLIALAVGASRDALRPWLCWLGCLAFTAYNYAIYAFSVHFGPLFLVWVAVLGLSLFALIGGLATLEGEL